MIKIIAIWCLAPIFMGIGDSFGEYAQKLNKKNLIGMILLLIGIILCFIS